MSEIKRVWKKLPDTNYSISSDGNIRNDIRNKINSKYTTPDGYHTVNVNGKTTQIHRLVAKVFLDTYSDELVVNHLDFNRTNNHYKNLEMCTVGENVRHSSNVGRYTKRGESNNNCKYKDETILMIKTYLDMKLSCADISRLTGINRRYINGIKLGKR